MRYALSFSRSTVARNTAASTTEIFIEEYYSYPRGGPERKAIRKVCLKLLRPHYKGHHRSVLDSAFLCRFNTRLTAWDYKLSERQIQRYFADFRKVGIPVEALRGRHACHPRSELLQARSTERISALPTLEANEPAAATSPPPQTNPPDEMEIRTYQTALNAVLLSLGLLTLTFAHSKKHLWVAKTKRPGTNPEQLSEWLAAKIRRYRPRSPVGYGLTCIDHNWARPQERDYRRDRPRPKPNTDTYGPAPSEPPVTPAARPPLAPGSPQAQRRPISTATPPPELPPRSRPRSKLPAFEFRTVRGWHRPGPNRALLDKLHADIEAAWPKPDSPDTG